MSKLKVELLGEAAGGAAKLIRLAAKAAFSAFDYGFDGQVTITANSEIGASKEIVNIDRMGSDIDIAFNAKYFSDVLKVLDDEYVCLDMNTNISPCVVKPETGDEYYYLILPVRLFAGN